ncbi:hypothetical protein Tco_0035320 [Tanacetum coccineum]
MTFIIVYLLVSCLNMNPRRFQKLLKDAMQEELLQFEIQKVWILVDLPFRKKSIGTKWVYRNKKDERGVVVVLLQKDHLKHNLHPLLLTLVNEVPIEQQNDPSPRPSPSTIIPDSIPETSGGNLGGHSS